MLSWEIENQLVRGQRPGYSGERGAKVSQGIVDAWVDDARAFGVRSIICLLAEDQLELYAALPMDLPAYYRNAGFAVAHVPARDHQQPPLTASHLKQIWEAYESLPKPVLIHCSAGIDRTGYAVNYIKEQVRVTKPAFAADGAMPRR
jgi:protein-tyrosine phosphatase